MPQTGHALELVLTAIVELERLTNAHGFDGVQYQHLVRRSQGSDPRRQTPGSTGNAIWLDFNIAGMDSGAQVETNFRHSLKGAESALDRLG